MKSHWVIHMKSGLNLYFNEECRYIQILEEGVIYAMTSKNGRLLAIIPISNIHWAESITELEEKA